MPFAEQAEWKFNNIATATTTTVKSGQGRFLGIMINGGTLTGAITVYNNTAASGATIATIAANQSAGDFYFYGSAKFDTGLTILTAAAVNCTVIYK